MYAELLLENFQSHVRSRIRLAGEGQLTVVLGPSDSGKTAVIRALRWLWFNDAPSDFIRIGAEFARVSLKLENGDLVIRERGKSYNRYSTVVGGQRQTYEGFGTGVPLEVRQALGVWPVQFGQDVEIWPTLSEQLDAPFLGKSVSAPAKARVLGKLAGTEEVDLAMRGAASDALKASQAAGQAEDEVRKLDGQIAGYGYLDALEQTVAKGEELLAKGETDMVKRDRIRTLRDQGIDISRGITAAERTIARLKSLPAVEVLIGMATSNHGRRQTLAQAQGRWNDLKTNTEQTTQKLGALAGTDAAAGKLAQASGHTERLNTLRRHRDTLAGIAILEAPARQSVTHLANLESAAAAVAKAEQIAGRLISLGRARETCVGINASERTTRQTLTRVTGAAEAAEKLAGVSELIQRQAAIVNVKGNLQRLIEDTCEACASIVVLEKAAAEASDQYLAELTAAGRCPVCGSEIKPECVKEVA